MLERIERQITSTRVILLLLFGAAYWLVWYKGTMDRLEELAEFHRVQLRMTEAEVLATLGKPPGNYGPSESKYTGPFLLARKPPLARVLFWGGHAGKLAVSFGEAGAVREITLWHRVTMMDDLQDRLFGKKVSPIVWQKKVLEVVPYIY